MIGQMTPSPNPAAFPSVGMYAMHHMHGEPIGTLCLLAKTDTPDRFGIYYIPSGGSSWSWPASEFTPVTNPHQIAICKLHEARVREGEMRRQMELAQRDVAKWSGVVDCFEQSKREVAGE